MLQKPQGAGEVARTCDVEREAPDKAWEDASERSARWRLPLRDEARERAVGIVEVEWTYWITGAGDVHLREVCWRASGVPDDLAVRTEIHSLPFQPEAEPLRLLLHVFVTVVGAVEVADKSESRIVDHPHAVLSRKILTAASGVEIQSSENLRAGFRVDSRDGKRHVVTGRDEIVTGG